MSLCQVKKFFCFKKKHFFGKNLSDNNHGIRIHRTMRGQHVLKLNIAALAISAASLAIQFQAMRLQKAALDVNLAAEKATLAKEKAEFALMKANTANSTKANTPDLPEVKKSSGFDFLTEYINSFWDYLSALDFIQT